MTLGKTKHFSGVDGIDARFIKSDKIWSGKGITWWKNNLFIASGMIQSCLDGDADDDPIWEEHWVYLKMPPESTGILMISL